MTTSTQFRKRARRTSMVTRSINDAATAASFVLNEADNEMSPPQPPSSPSLASLKSVESISTKSLKAPETSAIVVTSEFPDINMSVQDDDAYSIDESTNDITDDAIIEPSYQFDDKSEDTEERNGEFVSVFMLCRFIELLRDTKRNLFVRHTFCVSI